jgi:FixJ family two-component response regulator
MPQPIIGIVDDDPSCREALTGLLRSFDFTPCAFASARELLDSDRLADLGCTIVDIQMPGMSGLDLLDHLMRSAHQMPVILVTSAPILRYRSQALKAGAVGLLAKPFDDDELLRHVCSALSGRARGAPAVN